MSRGEGSIFQYLNILSGDAFSKATLFALSISPYITSSIVMQLLTIAIPALEKLQKSGEEGQKKITQITRYVTVALGLITAYGYYMYMRNYGVLTDKGIFAAIVIIACYSAGTALIMWLAEKINENGIGNGISLILFANIVSSGPTIIAMLISYITSPILRSWGTVIAEVIIILSVVIVVFVVFVTNSERRLPVQYAKKVVGRKMYGGQSTNLPIKLNMSGVMPIIFANSIVALPSTIALLFPTPKEGSFWYGFQRFFSYSSWFYSILFFILIIAFAYFYIAISFNPIEVSNNLKKNGGFIPGIRPGKPTSDYITKVLGRITLIGAIFLGIIAVFPLIVNIASGSSLGSIAFGGSSLLIVIGVVLETFREIEAQMTMRHYKGFLE
jgi:preprotein translocase subunit SecY